MRKTSPHGGLVYSTESGRMCPACRRPVQQCACGSPPALPAGDGIARVQRETKGRGGKAVTLVRGLALEEEAIAALAKRLRTACGTGGTVKNGVIELQGDHVDRLMALLAAEGLRSKRAGG
jgi:translation initiation factor 1